MNQVKVLLLLLFVGGFLQPSRADQSNPTLKEADRLYDQRLNPKDAEKALQLYETIISSQPIVEAYWKASRAGWWQGEHTSLSKNKIEFFIRKREFIF